MSYIQRCRHLIFDFVGRCVSCLVTMAGRATHRCEICCVTFNGRDARDALIRHQNIRHPLVNCRVFEVQPEDLAIGPSTVGCSPPSGGRKRDRSSSASSRVPESKVAAMEIGTTDETAFKQKYSTHRILGRGGGGVVMAGVSRSNGKPIALKHIVKEEVNEWMEEN